MAAVRALILRLLARVAGQAIEGVTSSRLELQVECRHLQQLLAGALEREAYWKARYERLADARLFKTGEIHAPVHEEPPKREPRRDTTASLMAALSVTEIGRRPGGHEQK